MFHDSLLKKNWRAPWKGGVCMYFRCDFSSCSEFTEIWQADSFCVKKCPCFFKEGWKICTKYAQNSTISPPPPPLSLSISKQHSILFLESQNTVHVSFTLSEGGRGEGCWTFKNMFEALFPHLWEKTEGHFLTQKELACQIQRILSNLKNCNEIGTYASLDRALQLEQGYSHGCVRASFNPAIKAMVTGTTKATVLSWRR